MNKEKRGLSSMSEIMDKFKVEQKKEIKKPPHELAAIVDEIQKVLGFKTKDKYGYMYWLRKVKGRKYNEVLGLLKQVENAGDKYSKGGLLTNLLSNKKKCIKK